MTLGEREEDWGDKTWTDGKSPSTRAQFQIHTHCKREIADERNVQTGSIAPRALTGKKRSAALINRTWNVAPTVSRQNGKDLPSTGGGLSSFQEDSRFSSRHDKRTACPRCLTRIVARGISHARSRAATTEHVVRHSTATNRVKTRARRITRLEGSRQDAGTDRRTNGRTDEGTKPDRRRQQHTPRRETRRVMPAGFGSG